MKNVRVLLVEDDLITLKVYQRILTQWGYEINYANDGYLALQMLEDQAYDLLITDNQLPFMNGIELINRVAKRHPSLNIILLSGEEMENRNNLNFTSLIKPIMPEFLRFQIERTLNPQLIKQSA